MRQKQTRFIRKLLYTLKKNFGFPITFYTITGETLDYETGKKTPTTIYKEVKKVIVLPGDLQRKFEYDLTFVAANRNFTYGGFYDTATRRIIVDAQDLDDFKIEMGSYYIWDEKRWEVARVFDLEYKTAYLIIGKLVEGTTRYMIKDINIESTLQLTQQATVT